MSHFVTNNSWRTQHELFTKHVGYNNPTELILIFISPILLYWSRSLIIMNWLPKLKNSLVLILVDFATIILPILWLLTLASDHIVTFYSTLLALIVTWISVFCFKHWSCSLDQKPLNFNLSGVFDQSFDICRCTTFLLSCTMIYCIDLPICPRRFAKTESGGLGLMDVGTGLFVAVSAGSGPNDYLKFNRKPHRQSFAKCFMRSAFPCLLLGVLRTLILQNVDYQNPETEYGVHWNFFYTVFLIRLFSLIIFHPNFVWGRWLMNMYVPYRSVIHLCLATGFLVLSEYAGPMLCAGLNPGWQVDTSTLDFIKSHRNDSLLMANFEGIVSTFGYMSIYLYFSSTYLMYRFIFRSEVPQSLPWKEFVFVIFIFTLLPSVILYRNGLGSVSRRFANTSYVSVILIITVLIVPFCCSTIVTQIIVSQLLDTVFSPSIIMSSLASQGMLYFLLSNLVTGILNCSLDTLRFLNPNDKPSLTTGSFSISWASSLQQFIILVVYEMCSILPFILPFSLRSKSDKRE